MRLDRSPIMPFRDDDGVIRPAWVLAERDGRVLVMFARGVGATHVAWWPADRLERSDADARGGRDRRAAAAQSYRRGINWTAAGVIVSGALALLALVVQQVNRRTDLAEARRGSAEASRRADAAQAAGERSAAATERMAKAQEDQAVAAARAAPTPHAAWTLAAAGDGNFLLTNAGNAVAHAVHIDLGNTGGAFGNVLDHQFLAPGSSVRFLSAPDYDTTDDTVTVTWATEPGVKPTETWKRPLPPQPSTGGWAMAV